MVQKNVKDMIAHLKSYKGQGMNGMKRLDFINKRLREKHDASVYMKNIDDAMLQYYRVVAKQIKPLPSVPQLSDFYHPSEAQKNGDLLLVAVGTDIATYALYKYLK